MRDTRRTMKEFRKAHGMNREQMAKACMCSAGLLRMIEEEGFVTHPHIASRIAAAYMLDVDGYNDLVPEEHKAKKLPRAVMPPKGSPIEGERQERRLA